MQLTNHEIQILRELAKEYAQIAALPEQAERRRLWEKLNRLEMERPMVLIDQIPWPELALADPFIYPQLPVSNPYWRQVESLMRQTIYKWKHMPGDMVVDPYVCLPRPITDTGWGIEMQVEHLISEGAPGVSSQRMTNQINGMEDVERIQMPQVFLDTEKEALIIQQAHQIFDGILDFKMTGLTLHLGIWDTISFWMGVENCYIELMDRPEMIHAMMEKLTQGLIGRITQMNALGLFDIYSNSCHCSHTYSSNPLREEAHRYPQSQDSWALGMAQLFTSVSPAVTQEFEVDYMKRVFAHMGNVYYGCCDRLDDRLDIIDQLPNVRKLSCSPWSDRDAFAANLPTGKYVMSNKPTPAFLGYSQFDEEAVRKDIRHTLAAARAHNVNVEFILKDISTVRHDPARLWRWSEIVLEEVCR